MNDTEMVTDGLNHLAGQVIQAQMLPSLAVLLATFDHFHGVACNSVAILSFVAVEVLLA